MTASNQKPASWIADVLALGGLSLLAAGLWAMYDWPTAAIVTGTVLLVVGVWGASR